MTAPKDELFEEERCVACWIEIPIAEPNDSTKTSIGGNQPSQSSSRAQSQLQTPPKVEHQLIAVTYSGGWYRLALPSSSRPRSRSISTVGTSSSSTTGAVTITGETVRSASPNAREISHVSRKTATLASTSPKGKGTIQNYKSESVRESVVGSAASAKTVRERVFKGKMRDADEASSTTLTSGSASGEPGRRCTLVEFRKIGRWDGW